MKIDFRALCWDHTINTWSQFSPKVTMLHLTAEQAPECKFQYCLRSSFLTNLNDSQWTFMTQSSVKQHNIDFLLVWTHFKTNMAEYKIEYYVLSEYGSDSVKKYTTIDLSIKLVKFYYHKKTTWLQIYRPLFSDTRRISAHRLLLNAS